MKQVPPSGSCCREKLKRGLRSRWATDLTPSRPRVRGAMRNASAPLDPPQHLLSPCRRCPLRSCAPGPRPGGRMPRPNQLMPAGPGPPGQHRAQ
eukprot:6051406-Alexandrium_andersonii.AAC.1